MYDVKVIYKKEKRKKRKKKKKKREISTARLNEESVDTSPKDQMRYRVRFSLDLRVIDEFIRIVSSRLIELYTASNHGKKSEGYKRNNPESPRPLYCV